MAAHLPQTMSHLDFLPESWNIHEGLEGLHFFGQASNCVEMEVFIKVVFCLRKGEDRRAIYIPHQAITFVRYRVYNGLSSSFQSSQNWTSYDY